jgi:hypothetical protein
MFTPKKAAFRDVTIPLLITVFLISTAAYSGCTKAKGKLIETKTAADFQVTSEGPDAGVTVTLVIKNVGDAGNLTINPEISCSEGTWERSQQLFFDADETKRLTYFFSEPSISATNIQGKVAILPW